MGFASHTVGFGRREATPAPESVVASAAPHGRVRLPRWSLTADARPNDEIVAELAALAEEHAPDAGYGGTAWNADTGTVFWQSADWTSNDEVDAAEAAFRAVEGVLEYESEAEAALPDGEGWERVWPPVTSAAGPWPPQAAATPEAASEGLLATAMRALTALAEKPAAPAPDIHVHVGSPDLHVQVDQAPAPDLHVDVHVPEREQHFAIEAPAPTPVVVNVPEQPAPSVEVTVEAPPAPNVTVEVPRPGPIRVETLEDGGRVYIPEPAE